MSAAVASIISGALGLTGVVLVAWLAYRQKQIEAERVEEQKREEARAKEVAALRSRVDEQDERERALRRDVDGLYEEVRACHDARSQERRAAELERQRWEVKRRSLERRLRTIEDEVARWKAEGLIPFDVVDDLERRLDVASRRQDESDERHRHDS